MRAFHHPSRRSTATRAGSPVRSAGPFVALTGQRPFAAGGPDRPRHDEETAAAGPPAPPGYGFDRIAIHRRPPAGERSADGRGRPLESALRERMERALGHPLDGVRVAEDPALEPMGAAASTRGPAIRFAPGMFRPHTPAGRALLAHELTHVVQQRRGCAAANAQAAGMAIDARPELEAEADRAAARVVRGETAARVPAAARAAPEAVVGSGGGQTAAFAPPAQMAWMDWAKKAGLGLATVGGGVAAGVGAAALGATAGPIALAALAGGVVGGGLAYGAYRGIQALRGGGGAAATAPAPPRPRAEDRLTRWAARDDARHARERMGTGRFDTPTGPVTVSGIHNQRMTQARRGDYGGETLGSLPPYSDMQRDMPEEGVRALYDPTATLGAAATPRQRLATSLATTVSNVSEPDRISGWGKVVRGLARRRSVDPSAPHPLSPSVNTAVSTAEEARDVMRGTTPLNPDQRRAIDEHASDSSDEDDDWAASRKGLLRKRKGD